VRSNVLQPAAAALAAACIAVPACVPAAQVAAHSAVPAIESHSVALPVALSASTTDLLNALGLFVEVPLWLTAANPAGGPTATNVPPLPAALKPGGLYGIASYSSAFTVINAAIKIISAPAVDLTTGQFGNIQADTQKAITAFQTAWKNLSPSVIATLQYAISQLTTALGGAPAAATSDATVSALAAAPTATTPNLASLLDAAGLLVQVPLWLSAANPAGGPTATNVPPLPAALKPGGLYDIASYSSAFTVLNAAIKIVSAPAVDLTTGQFGNIQADTQKAITAFQTAWKNLGPSVSATLQYAATQIATDLGLAPAPAKQKLAVSAAAVKTETTVTDSADVTTTTATPKALTAATPKPASHGFLKQLQGAVDNEVGGSTVKVGTTGSASAAPGSSTTGTPKVAKQHHAAKSAAAGAKSASGSAK
jgi:hypothetical protein